MSTIDINIIAPRPHVAITCKAAVAWGAGESLVMEQVEVSPPQAMEIRIQVVSTSLCRSDFTAWQSHGKRQIPFKRRNAF
nr:alcohol dehydrogenase-like 6 [Quercus suber]